jgi:L-asparagine transporter-like permease
MYTCWAAETKDPARNLPKAINSIPIRIIIFYVLALLIVMSVTLHTNKSKDCNLEACQETMYTCWEEATVSPKMSKYLLTVRLFGELEFWFALIKILAIIILIAVGLWMIFTGFTSSTIAATLIIAPSTGEKGKPLLKNCK